MVNQQIMHYIVGNNTQMLLYRSIHLFASGVLLFLFFPLFVFAFESERITEYEVLINIHSDARITITEKIDYDFGSGMKRGIFREIPTVFTRADGKHFRITISDIAVHDQRGVPYEYEVKEGRDYVRIDVGGDEPKFTGMYTYILTYAVDRVMIHWDRKDTFHWNVIGFDWTVPIMGASATVNFPDAIAKESVHIECTVGFSGSTEKCADITNIKADSLAGEGEVYISGAHFAHNKMLGNGKGMTLLLEFPKGIINEQELQEVDSIPGIFFIFLALSGIIPLYSLYKIYRIGKNPKEGGPIVRQYDAPNTIDPLLTGVVLSKSITVNNLIGELVALSMQGYIRIVHFQERRFLIKKSRYLYLKLHNNWESLSQTERVVLDMVFNHEFHISSQAAKKYVSNDPDLKIDLSEDIENAVAITDTKKMKKTFQASFKHLSDRAKSEAVKRGFFEKEFNTALKSGIFTGLPYFAIAAALAGIMAVIVWFGFSNFYLGIWIQGLIAFGVVFGFSVAIFILLVLHYLPRRTDKGIELRKHILGLKAYISAAEKERFDFHYNPKNNPELVEKLLPYAIALGLGKKWVQHIEDLAYKPNWYKSSSAVSFNGSSMGSMISSLSTTTSSSVGRSGGGAGSGAGGGGGGSR